MGTRCLTKVYDEDTEILCLYRQYDGYPDGHGKELADFLSGMKVVNGFGAERAKLANGMGCLAAQIVAHFKKGVGAFYVYPVGSKDVGEEYVYHVRLGGGGSVEVTTEEA